jgi:hypothetical protein
VGEIATTDDTRPPAIDGGPSSGEERTPWQQGGAEWSFGARERRLLLPPKLGDRPTDPAPSPRSNRNGGETSGPQRVDVPNVLPVSLPRRRFGQRSLMPLSHWEGVVEKLTEGGFRARLVPFRNGQADRAAIEYADFSNEELTEADLDLIEPNAVFYWTIAKRRNAAGTVTNESLVRFRRLAQPTAYEQQLAAHEADDLLESIGPKED